MGIGPNCNCYRNNDLDDGGGAINTELDGLTQVFFATGTILPGTNHIMLAIANAGDPVLDSDVMIGCLSFTCVSVPVTGACCHDNGTCQITLEVDCGDIYMGNRTVCDPKPCTPTADVDSGNSGSHAREWLAARRPARPPPEREDRRRRGSAAGSIWRARSPTVGARHFDSFISGDAEWR